MTRLSRSVAPRRPALFRPQSISTPPAPPVTGFVPGPTGLKKPWNWTDAYSKTASVTVTDQASLQTAINAANPGDVIEANFNIAGISTNHVVLTTPSGWSARTQAVLVRPPIGTRRSAAFLDIKGHHLIVGGFNFTGTIGANAVDPFTAGSPSIGVGYWRCVATNRGAGVSMWGTRRGVLCEVVMPARCYNIGGDRVDAYAHGAVDQEMFTMDGCWIAGGVKGTQTDYVHIGELNNLTAGDYTSTVSASGTIGTILVALRNLPAGSSATATLTVNGTQVWTGTVPDTAGTCGDVQDYRYISGLSRAVTSGQSVTLTLSNVVGTIPNLELWAGVDNATHCDTLQFGCAGAGPLPVMSGSVTNALVLDSVLQGSTGSCCQFNYTLGGDMRFLRNWMGTAVTGLFNLSGFQNLDRTQTTNDRVRLHLVNNHFTGSPNLITGNSPLAISTTDWTETIFGNSSTLTWAPDADGSNSSGATVGTPALPDLTALWPECPIAVSN